MWSVRKASDNADVSLNSPEIAPQPIAPKATSTLRLNSARSRLAVFWTDRTSSSSLISAIANRRVDSSAIDSACLLRSSEPMLPFKTFVGISTRTKVAPSPARVSSSSNLAKMQKSIRDYLQSLWEEFTHLFLKSKKKESPSVPFKLEFADWRSGNAVWAGSLPILQNRTYYLEVCPVSLADKRELGIKPPPTHTFRLHYFTNNGKGKIRTTVFCCHLNCYVFGRSVPDYTAVELLEKLAQRVKIVSLQSRINTENIGTLNSSIQIQTIQRPGELPLLKLDQNSDLPAVVILGKSHPERSQKYWQDYLELQLQEIKKREEKRLNN